MAHAIWFMQYGVMQKEDMIMTSGQAADKGNMGSLVLQQPWSVLMSTTPGVVQGYVDSSGLGCLLCPLLGSRSMLLLGPYRSGWPWLPPGMGTPRPRLLPRTVSGSVVLPQPRSMLMSMACVATKGHMSLVSGPQPVALLVFGSHTAARAILI